MADDRSDASDADNTNESQGGTPPSGQPRPPVDDRASHGSAPAPPPGYYWGPPPQGRKRGFFGAFSRVVSAVAIAAALVGLGYYLAIISFVSAPQERVSTSLYQPGEGKQKVAIVPVRGMIAPEMAGFVRDAVDTIVEDKDVRAVVLRVDSGGGMVAPSDQIYHQLKRIGEERGIPVIASFGGFAASGGYYVACAAEHIIAEPTCVTGSIGVIANVITVQGTLENLLDAQAIVETAEGSPNKSLANSPLQRWDEQDRGKLRSLLTAMHERFRGVVADAREQRITDAGATLDAVSDGSAMMVDQAVAMGLVDKVGYRGAAIDEAIKRGGFDVPNPPVVAYGPPRSVLEMLGVSAGQGERFPKLDGDSLRQTITELTAPRIMYWYPGAG